MGLTFVNGGYPGVHPGKFTCNERHSSRELGGTEDDGEYQWMNGYLRFERGATIRNQVSRLRLGAFPHCPLMICFLCPVHSPAVQGHFLSR